MPPDKTKDDMGDIDEEAFPDKMFMGNANDPPDIKPATLTKTPDTSCKRRISLCRRSSSSHSDSNTELITGDDVASDKNISSIGNKEIDVEGKPDQPLEMNEIKVEEQVTPLHPARQVLLRDGDEMHDVSPDDKCPSIGLVDSV